MKPINAESGFIMECINNLFVQSDEYKQLGNDIQAIRKLKEAKILAIAEKELIPKTLLNIIDEKIEHAKIGNWRTRKKSFFN